MKIKYTLCVLLSLMANLFLVAQTDQTLQWASFFGGEDPFDPITETWPSQMLPSPDGGMLACGRTDSPTGLVVPPAHQVFMQGDVSGFFVKIDADRYVEYASYFGGEGYDYISDLAVFSDGGFVIVGSTSSYYGITTPNAFMADKPEGTNGFVARFTSGGQLMWSTYLGGDANPADIGTLVTSVIVDQEDNIYCVGTTSVATLPVTSESHQMTHGGGRDGFVARFSPEGIPGFITYLGGVQEDRATSIRFADNDHIIVGGISRSTSHIATPGSYQENNGGGSDAFLIKMTTDGVVNWGTYFGGANDDYMGVLWSPNLALDIDENGNIYVAMRTSSVNLETIGIDFTEIDHFELILIAQFSPEGTLNWARYLPYRPVENITGLRFCGETLLVSGAAFSSSNNLAFGNPFQSQVNSLSSPDMFLLGLNDSGDLLWGTFYGGQSRDLPISLSCLEGDELLLSGATKSNGIAITPDAFQPEKSSSVNALFAIFEVSSLTGMADDEQLQMGVFPNPSSGRVWLELSAEFSFTADVTVQSISGQLLSRHERFNTQEPLNLPETPGMYIITARNGEAIARARVLVY